MSLKEKYKEQLVVIGDKKCYLQNYNNYIPEYYLRDIYKDMINIISSAKLIITPTSHWTYIANLQKVPVISFGIFNKLYMKKGIYNFNNKGIYLPKINNNKIINTIISKMEELLC
jgi:hypothetical protein